MAEMLTAVPVPLSPRPDWFDDHNAVILETMIDVAIEARSIAGGIVGPEVLDKVADTIMESVYALVDAQVTIAENAGAYDR